MRLRFAGSVKRFGMNHRLSAPALVCKHFLSSVIAHVFWVRAKKKYSTWQREQNRDLKLYRRAAKEHRTALPKKATVDSQDLGDSLNKKPVQKAEQPGVRNTKPGRRSIEEEKVWRVLRAGGLLVKDTLQLLRRYLHLKSEDSSHVRAQVTAATPISGNSRPLM